MKESNSDTIVSQSDLEYKINITRIVNQFPLIQDTTETTLLFSSNTTKNEKNANKVVQILIHSYVNQKKGASKTSMQIPTPFEKSFDAFKNLKLKFVCDSNEISKIEGYNLFQKRIDKFYKSAHRNDYPIIDPSEAIFPESYFIDLFDDIFNLLPNSLNENSKFVKARKIIFLDESLLLNMTYISKKCDNNIFWMDAQEKIRHVFKFARTHEIEMTGSIESRILADLTSGNLLGDTTTIKLSGYINLGGVNHKITVTENYELVSKKSN